MVEIDYALAFKFVHPSEPGVPYQLVFRIDPRDKRGCGNPWVSNPTGQLVATVSYPEHPAFGLERGVSRAGIRFLDAEKAVDAGNWPMISEAKVDLAAVVRRVSDAGLV